MAEATGAAEVQGAEAATPTGSEVPVQGTEPESVQGTPEVGLPTVEALQAKIEDLTRDNVAYRERERLRQAEAPQVETLTSRIAELESQLSSERQGRQEQSLRLASVTEAQRLGFRNPDLAYRLLDASSVDFGENGSPRNVAKLLQDVAKADPYLLVTTDFGGGTRGESPASGASSDMNAIIRRASGRPA